MPRELWSGPAKYMAQLKLIAYILFSNMTNIATPDPFPNLSSII